MNKFIVVILLFFSPLLLPAQEMYVLTLQDAVQLAQKQSPLAISAIKQAKSQEWSYKSASANRLPQIGFNSNLPGFTRSINSVVQPDGRTTFVQQRQAFSNGGFTLDQNLMTTGGRVSLSSGLSRIDIIDANNAFSTQWQSTPLLVTYSQPVGRVNDLKWNWRLQGLRYKQSQKRLAEQLEDLNLQITQKFFDLIVAEKSLRNSEKNVAVNDTIFMLAKGRFGLGKIAENDLLQSELALMNARNNFNQQKLMMSNLEMELKNMLGLNKDDKIVLKAPTEIPNLIIDPEKAVAEAKKNRSDMIGNEIQLVQASYDLKSAKSDARPGANLSVSYGLNQTSNDVGTVYNTPLDQQRFSVGINIPIYGFGKNRASVMSAKENFESQQVQVAYNTLTFEQAIRFKVMEFDQLRERMVISAKADTIAQKRFEVTKNRYLIGKIDVTNLTIAQNEKDDALRSYLQTLGDMWAAYYQLRRLTLYDFEKNALIGEN